jgi:hypothetical protein
LQVLPELIEIKAVVPLPLMVAGACELGAAADNHPPAPVRHPIELSSRLRVESQIHTRPGCEHMGIRRLFCRVVDVRSNRYSD